MIALAIWAGAQRVGTLEHDTATGLFDFRYEPTWCDLPEAFPIGPQLALPNGRAVGTTPLADLASERRSVIVRSFFQNLLPEGQPLDVAAQANGVSKANLAGLLLALGSETAGALRVTLPDPLVPLRSTEVPELRELTHEELSGRIRSRDATPFSVWDGKVRLSIAGLQDKIAVFEKENRLFLVGGERLASTVILKPAPSDGRFSCLPFVEHTCMQLAAGLGIETADTHLMHVPEPVLVVDRFDRRRQNDADGKERIQRLHIVDACQAIGLGPEAKYELMYGDDPAVRHMRDGASLKQLFALADISSAPLLTRASLLDRVLFNILIGNSDAHGKNWSFFVEPGAGLLRLAPAYDLVDVDAFDTPNMSKTFAMGLGDAFGLDEVTAFELASMAKQCGITRPHLAARIKHLTWAGLRVLADLREALVAQGVPLNLIQELASRLEHRCSELTTRATHLKSVAKDML